MRLVREESLLHLIGQIVKAFFSTMVCAAFLIVALVRGMVDTRMFFVLCAASLVTISGFRVALHLFFRRLHSRGHYMHRALLIGSNDQAERLARTFLQDRKFGYRLVGFLESSPYRSYYMTLFDIPYLGPIEALKQVLSERVIDGVYIALPLRSHYAVIQEIAALCEGVGVPVRLVADLFPTQRSAIRMARKGDVALVSMMRAAGIGIFWKGLVKALKRPAEPKPSSDATKAEVTPRRIHVLTGRRILKRIAYIAVQMTFIGAAFAFTECMLSQIYADWVLTGRQFGCMVVFAAFWIAQCIKVNFWSARDMDHATDLVAAVNKTVGDAVVFWVFVGFTLYPNTLNREFLVVFGCSVWLALIAFHAAMHRMQKLLWAAGRGLRSVVILGLNERTEKLMAAITPQSRQGYRILGILDDDPASTQKAAELGCAYLGAVDRFEPLVLDGKVGEVFLCLPLGSHYESARRAIALCEKHALPAHVMADLFPMQIARTKLMYFDDIPLLSLSTIPESTEHLAIKRAFDFTVASLLIATLAPLFLAIALAVKLTSPGPIFYTQERIGQNRRRFRMIKFRSMRVDADTLRADLESMNDVEAPAFKIKNDPRVTAIGQYLRRFSLDELPQLFNVWMGQMSLVGPRPPVPEEADQYSWTQMRRLSVKPGITGLWQVSGRSDIPFQQGVALDLSYIDNWSLQNDIKIILRTFGAVLSTRGAL
jgi:exopolysaccharide biosynthesis polyprenyl glycosylphosphotransferase